MSIIISNISKEYSRTGIQPYEICLNNTPLTTFEHMSEDGMAECMRASAEALDKVDIDRVILENERKVVWKILLENGTEG